MSTERMKQKKRGIIILRMDCLMITVRLDSSANQPVLCFKRLFENTISHPFIKLLLPLPIVRRGPGMGMGMGMGLGMVGYHVESPN